MTRNLLPLAACLLAAPAAAAGTPGKLEFNRDIRPILAETCFACHGPDSAARKAGLRLDRREAAVEKGDITPRKPDASELVTRIFLPDGDEQAMPPAKSHKTLKPEQKELLKRWVAEGAEYQPHWSFIPPRRPAVPPAPHGWVARNPIDNFVFA